MSTRNTLVHTVLDHAQKAPEEIAYTHLADGVHEDVSVTFGMLDKTARAIAVALRAHCDTGDRALLLYPFGIEYILGFLGCLYAGVIAVPAYPPSGRGRPNDARLLGIMQSAKPSLILTHSDQMRDLEQALTRIETRDIPRILSTNALDTGLADGWKEPTLNENVVAFLQYTSGSTRDPHGVIVTHGNLLSNEQLIAGAFEHDEHSIIGGWLPLFHDMGLIGNTLQPMFVRARCVLMPPGVFLQNPSLWLSMISRYRVTTSGAPNFAYDLCVKHVSAEARRELDLSSWTIAFNGAEPVSAATLLSFTKAFESCGFRCEAFYPCYGLAEATLMVSGGRKLNKPHIRSFDTLSLEQNKITEAGDAGARALVGCGNSLEGHTIVIADPETLTLCSPEEVGEICVSGPSVAAGYWGLPKESHATFCVHVKPTGEGPFLRTGDLGFVSDGELFITGRIKDLIIVRGRNHYPQDIESTVENAHVALKRHSGAAFSIDTGGAERLVVCHELERTHRAGPFQGIIEAIRDAIAAEHQLEPSVVVLIRPGSIPKTSSGKIQRSLCRRLFIKQKLSVLYRYDASRDPLPGNDAGAFLKALLSADAHNRKSLLMSFLSDLTAMSPAEGMAACGEKCSRNFVPFDSLRAVEMAWRLERELNLRIPVAQLLSDPKLESVADFILEELTKRSSEADSFEVNAHRQCGFIASVGDAPAMKGVGEKHASTNRFPVSLEQERLWLLHQSDPDSSKAFQILVTPRLQGPLNVPILEQAIRYVIDRHETLRSTFELIDGNLVQVIQDTAPVPLATKNFGSLSMKRRELALRDFITAEAQKPFDLKNGPLWRFYLLQIGPTEHILMMLFHHICCDGWSIRILLDEIFHCYCKGSDPALISLPKLPCRYVDFAVDQHRGPNGTAIASSLDYWRQRLANPPPLLPLTEPSNGAHNLSSNQMSFFISDTLARRVRELSEAEGVTSFMTLLAAFKCLLVQLTGTTDILVGSSSANRADPKCERLVGPFTAPLILRTNFAGDPTFKCALARVRQTTLEAYAHQDAPFDKLVRLLQGDQPGERRAPFNVVFLFQNFLQTSFSAGDLQVRLQDFHTSLSNFDLALTLYERDNGLLAFLTYRPETLEAATAQQVCDGFVRLLSHLVNNVHEHLSTWDNGLQKILAERGSSPRGDENIVIAATFTAEPLKNPLRFWLSELGLRYRLEFSLYNTVFQQLLDPGSSFSRNNGFNVILIRFLDLVQECNRNGSEAPALTSVVDELCETIKQATLHATSHTVLIICPSDDKGKAEERQHWKALEARVSDKLSDVAAVSVMLSAEIVEMYPVEHPFDACAEAIGHIPYRPSFFTALGTMIVRRILSVKRRPYKVIVLDCDDTLWKGSCSEDGLSQIQVEFGHRTLQTCMIAQHRAGVLLCLCSKNREQDVMDVFASRTEMALKREHLITWRINWKAKSENIKSIAKELDVLLESIIFIDNSPTEVAEVRMNCPQVLALQVPQRSADVERFLRSVWAFDRSRITREDTTRSEFYRQNSQREVFRRSAASLDEFLATLGLSVRIEPLRPDHLARVSQLTRRTNQFNCTNIARSEKEIESLLVRGWECWTVEAKDRFGDYGLVGAFLFYATDRVLHVDTFLLSCRALGRRIEHEMMRTLGVLGEARCCTTIRVPFKSTSKNTPARLFLEQITKALELKVLDQMYEFKIPIRVAMAAHSAATSTPITSPAVKVNPITALPAESNALMRIVDCLPDLDRIHEAIMSWEKECSGAAKKSAHPATSTEKMLYDIWVRTLRREDIGMNDNFFNMGGNSLQGVLLLAEIKREFDVEISIHRLFESNTISDIADEVDRQLIRRLSPNELANALMEIDFGTKEVAT